MSYGVVKSTRKCLYYSRAISCEDTILSIRSCTVFCVYAYAHTCEHSVHTALGQEGGCPPWPHSLKYTEHSGLRLWATCAQSRGEPDFCRMSSSSPTLWTILHWGRPAWLKDHLLPFPFFSSPSAHRSSQQFGVKVKYSNSFFLFLFSYFHFGALLLAKFVCK